MKSKLICGITIFLTSFIYGQTDGFWDKERATTKEISLSAGRKKVLKTENLPFGTTEIVYRITVLEEGQKLTSSLVSVLKSIPDPTGLSQGTAGVIQISTALSGDDTCTYSLFTDENQAIAFQNDTKFVNACFEQKQKINKEAKLLNASSSCLTNIPDLWFGFESQNWLMNQKIVLEVVPWVDVKASRGWNTKTKSEIIALAKKLPIAPKLSKKELFYTSFLENISKNYKYHEFTKLLVLEKNLAIEKSTEESLKNTGEVNLYYAIFRDRATEALKKGNVNEAIAIIQTDLIDKNRGAAQDYNFQGTCYLVSKQFSKAEEVYKKGSEMYPYEILFQLNLAHVYLFTDRVSEAKDIHKKYLNENVTAGKSWIDQTKEDFEKFGKYQLSSDNFNKILRILD